MNRASRRYALTVGLAALSLPGTVAAQDVGRASAFIQTTGHDLVAALNDSRASVGVRRDKVAAVLRRSVDLDGVGRFILGRWWKTATPQEQQEYLKLFEETLITNLASRFGEYQGVRFALGRTQNRTEEDVLISTVIERPNTAPFMLDWRVAEVRGHPKIVDVIAEGTSLRLTTRSEYSSVIQRNGGQVSALLAAMRNQIQQMASRATAG